MRYHRNGLEYFLGICLEVLVVVALPVLVPSVFVPVDLFVLVQLVFVYVQLCLFVPFVSSCIVVFALMITLFCSAFEDVADAAKRRHFQDKTIG